jgi:anaerobic selenocysteine-containing dehydrogenase
MLTRRDRIAQPWGARTAYGPGETWPSRDRGFYQSHQATAAAVQVNNVNIIRGMLGKPGAGILQMNGQPTAQNTRECGADGDLPAFRNWSNDAHIADRARVWNIDQMQIPHYSFPTHGGPPFT